MKESHHLSQCGGSADTVDKQPRGGERKTLEKEQGSLMCWGKCASKLDKKRRKGEVPLSFRKPGSLTHLHS